VPILHLVTDIAAPRELCFDLARSVDAHLASAADTGERAVAGVTAGLLALGDEVTWEAVHLGIRQRLSVRITALERPTFFVDEMVSGAFARFRHLHTFEATSTGTKMTDAFDFTSPLGPLGRMADALFLGRYMTRFLERRNDVLRTMAEARARSPDSA
jgi:ligand-binding SRPBCC domain-containing protein